MRNALGERLRMPAQQPDALERLLVLQPVRAYRGGKAGDDEGVVDSVSAALDGLQRLSLMAV